MTFLVLAHPPPSVEIKLCGLQCTTIISGDIHKFYKISKPETIPETAESGPLSITDLFQNKSVAYFWLFFYKFFNYFFNFISCKLSVRTLGCIFRKNKIICWPQEVEKAIPKSCILMAVGSFFSLCSPDDCPKQPRTSFPFYSTISGRISAQNQLFKR